MVENLVGTSIAQLEKLELRILFYKRINSVCDSNFNTIKNKNGRAICGLSMGGFGLYILVQSIQLFSAHLH